MMTIDAADTATAWSYPALDGEVVQERHVRFCAKYGHATHHVEDVLQERCPRCGDLREEAAVAPAAPVESAGTFAVWGQNTRTLTPAFKVETFATRKEADDYARGLKRLDEAKFDYWVQ